MSIESNIKDVKARIEKAAERAGRKSEDILLIAVSKTKPIEMLMEARNTGLTVFGENKVQEITEKYDHIPGARWHMIGHLQKNKVKYIIDKVDLIHSLDNIDLAEEIDKRAKKAEKVMSVLIQINIGNEDTKSGIDKTEIESFIEKLQTYENIRVEGLMAIPPVMVNEAETRKYFKEMKEIFEKLKKTGYNNCIMKYLSMGMSDDFEIAIEEGSNMVRVGTSIFGKRDYSKASE